MKYFIDTEFIERGAGKPIDLISIAVVAEDGREFYAVSTEFKARHASPWVKANVLPQLPPRNEPAPPYGSPRLFHESMAWMNHERMRREFLKFIGPDRSPEFWGWCCGFDYVVVCQMVGFDIWPSFNLPFYFGDIQQIADERGTGLEIQPGGNHNALEDARWVRHLFNRLSEH